MNNFAFIDGNNLHRGVEEVGWKLDYRKFRRYLKDKYDVVTAFYFVGFSPQYEGLYKSLTYAGFTLEFKEISVNKGEIKGNCDANLIVKAWEQEDNYDGAVLVANDGDYLCLAQHLMSRGKLHVILAPSYQYCSSLLKRDIGNQHLRFMDELRGKLEYKK